MEWFTTAFKWQTPHMLQGNNDASAEEITEVYHHYLKATDAQIQSALQFYSKETLFTIVVSLYPYQQYLQDTQLPSTLTNSLHQQGGNHPHTSEEKYYTHIHRLSTPTLATIILQSILTDPNADIRILSIGILTERNISYLSTLDLLRFMIAFGITPTIPLDRQMATNQLLESYTLLANSVQDPTLRQMLLGQAVYEYTPLYVSPLTKSAPDVNKQELLHPDYAHAVEKLIPEGNNLDAITHDEITIGAYYFQCTNPSHPHYFNTTSITNLCKSGNTRYGDCTFCPVCGYPMNTVVYQNGEISLHDINGETSPRKYISPSVNRRKSTSNITPRKLLF